MRFFKIQRLLTCSLNLELGNEAVSMRGAKCGEDKNDEINESDCEWDRFREPETEREDLKAYTKIYSQTYIWRRS